MTGDEYAAAYDLISGADHMIDAGFMPADMATADGLGWSRSFGYYAYREEADGNLP